MSKGKFNLKELLNKQSIPETERVPEAEPFMREIPLNKIIPSSKNKYGIRDLEDLTASMEMFGFNSNLVVRTIPGTDTYELISGERRYHALAILAEKWPGKFNTATCKVEYQPDDLLAELELIMANSTARVLTDWEKTYQAGRLEEILRQLKRDGHKLPGRLREIVADVLDVSSSQVGRMESINKNLTSEFKEEFKRENIGISDAYNLSTLPQNQQQEVYQGFKEKGKEAVKQVKKVKQDPERMKPEKNEPDSEPQAQPKEQADTPCEKEEYSQDETVRLLIAIAADIEAGNNASSFDVAGVCRAAADYITEGR